MLNVTSHCSRPEDAASTNPTPTFQRLTVRLDTGDCALPRLANLMAKLDIEPDRVQVEKSACGRTLEVVLDLNQGRGPLEKLHLRLQAMVTVQSISAIATA